MLKHPFYDQSLDCIFAPSRHFCHNAIRSQSSSVFSLDSTHCWSPGLSVLPESQLQALRSYAVITVDQDIPFLGSAFFIGFVIKHPFHHSFAVVFQGDNPEAH